MSFQSPPAVVGSGQPWESEQSQRLNWKCSDTLGMTRWMTYHHPKCSEVVLCQGFTEWLHIHLELFKSIALSPRILSASVVSWTRCLPLVMSPTEQTGVLDRQQWNTIPKSGWKIPPRELCQNNAGTCPTTSLEACRVAQKYSINEPRPSVSCWASDWRDAPVLSLSV